MNKENKSGEFKEKLLQYWAVFLSACEQLFEYVKVNGKALLQRFAAWLLKAKDWVMKVTADLRVKGKGAWENLSVWLAGLGEKVRPALAQIKDRCTAAVDRLKGDKSAETVEALPAVEEPKVLPEAAEEPVKEVVSVEETPVKAAVADQPAKAGEQTADPAVGKVGAVFLAIGQGIKFILKWLWKLRKLFMAIPVVWAAVKLAMENMDRLPEKVGLDIQSTGEFAQMITREEAVYWPLGITLFCLLLMFCSKKPVLPWVISIFTLILPWLIWILNYIA